MKNVIDTELDKAIKQQIWLCLFKKNYRSAIFISNRYKKDCVINALNNHYNKWFIKWRVHKVINNYNETCFQFKNGSFIRVMPANERMRGFRVNSVVIDAQIREEVINCIIRPMLVGYYYIPNKLFRIMNNSKFYYKKIKQPETIVEIQG